MQLCQRPCCQAFRIHGLGDLPNIASDLGVPPQIVDELGVGGSEQPLANRPKSCVGRRPGFFVHSYRANKVSKYVLSNSRPPSTTKICGSRLNRRTHSRRTIM